MRSRILQTFFILPFILACNESYAPKPRAYFRIDLPEKNYIEFDNNYPYSFKYNETAKIDTAGFKEKYWMNLYYPKLDGTIYMSYKSINSDLAKYAEDARKLAYKHLIKASSIPSYTISIPEKNVGGIIYEIEGNAASPMQFWVSDSIRHFVLGSVYFNSSPNPDSLSPLINYINEDVMRLIESLEWK